MFLLKNKKKKRERGKNDADQSQIYSPSLPPLNQRNGKSYPSYEKFQLRILPTRQLYFNQASENNGAKKNEKKEHRLQQFSFTNLSPTNPLATVPPKKSKVYAVPSANLIYVSSDRN